MERPLLRLRNPATALGLAQAARLIPDFAEFTAGPAEGRT